MRVTNLAGSLMVLGCLLVAAPVLASGSEQPRKDAQPHNTQRGHQAMPSLDGTWIGTTWQGQKISFKVESNAITSLTLRWNLELDRPCASPFHPQIATTKRGGTETWYFPAGSDYPPVKIIANRFEVSRDTSDVNIRITGTFGPDLAVSGTLELKNVPASSCTGSATGAWNATRATSRPVASTESAPGVIASRDCAFKCTIDKEGYAFDITCESGPVDTTMENRTVFEYGPQGQRKARKLIVNEKLMYEDSKNTYRVTGVIVIDSTTNTVQYDVSAVGGVFGSTARRCKSEGSSLLSPPSPESSVPASTVGSPLSVRSAPTFTPSIVIPACKQAYDAGKISGDTYLCMVSDKGDFIGGGKTWIHTPGTSTFSVELSGLENERVKAKVGEGAGNWDLSFVPVRARGWVAGVYENAERDPFQGPSNPGLEVSGHSRGCNKLSGRFEILELVTQGSPPELESFAANFVQHCDGGPALSGYLRFHSTVKP